MGHVFNIMCCERARKETRTGLCVLWALGSSRACREHVVSIYIRADLSACAGAVWAECGGAGRMPAVPRKLH